MFEYVLLYHPVVPQHAIEIFEYLFAGTNRKVFLLRDIPVSIESLMTKMFLKTKMFKMLLLGSFFFLWGFLIFCPKIFTKMVDLGFLFLFFTTTNWLYYNGKKFGERFFSIISFSRVAILFFNKSITSVASSFCWPEHTTLL